MQTLLQINSSLFSGQGHSSRLCNAFVEEWQQHNPTGRIIVRDLATQPIPHLTAERIQAFSMQPEERTAEQQAAAAEADALIQELQDADVIALGLPMYNFSVPSTLKAWFDHVARAGVTFRYTQDGPQGLLKNKHLVVLSARGGKHLGTASDTETALIETFFTFIGITDIDFIHAEGLAMGETVQKHALDQAYARIKALAAFYPNPDSDIPVMTPSHS